MLIICTLRSLCLNGWFGSATWTCSYQYKNERIFTPVAGRIFHTHYCGWSRTFVVRCRSINNQRVQALPATFIQFCSRRMQTISHSAVCFSFFLCFVSFFLFASQTKRKKEMKFKKKIVYKNLDSSTHSVSEWQIKFNSIYIELNVTKCNQL